MRKKLVYGVVLSVLALTGGVMSGGCAEKKPPVLTPEELEARNLPGIVQLTSSRDFEKAGEAYFSADMRWVVFQAVPKGQAGGAYQMYVARIVYVRNEPAGLVVVTRVTPPGSRNTCGYFSPDGRTLIFASTAGKDDPNEESPGYQRQGSRYRWAFSKGMEIYAVPDWEKKVVASVGGYVDLAKPEYRLTENEYYDAECSISPDGKWVVFCSDRPSLAGGVVTTQPGTQPVARPKNLWLMPLVGGEKAGLIQLTNTAGYNGGPFFSPDGNSVVYRSDRVGNDLLQVYIADLTKSWRGEPVGMLRNERAVTNDNNVNWAPYFTPDGDRVLYATSLVSHANYEIFSRRVDGSRETRITYSAGPDVLPVVSPDGKYLMWSSRRGEDKTTQIYIARLRFPQGS